MKKTYRAPSPVQKKLLIRLHSGGITITMNPKRAGLLTTSDGPHWKVSAPTLHACLKKGLLIGSFDAHYIPSWKVHPNIDEVTLKTWVAEMALGVIK